MLNRRTTFIHFGLVCVLAVGLLALAGGAGARGHRHSVDTTPPSVPDNMTQSATTGSSFTFTWSPSTDNVGVAGYDLARDGNQVGMTTDTSYTYTGLNCGTTYTVTLEAVDAVGNHSNGAGATGPASTSPCGPAETTPPSAPGNLTQSGTTQTSFTFSWSASTDNVGVTGYDLLRNGAMVGATNDTTYTYTGLTCGTTYAVAVQAHDAAGNRSSAAGATRSASTSACTPADATPPSTPGNLTQSGTTQTSFTFSWSASTDNVGVTGYDLLRNGAKLATTNSTTYTYTGLTCGATYTVAVQAYDAAGNRSSAAGATRSASTSPCGTADTTTPSVPSNPRTTGITQTSVALSWTASTDNVGVTGYGVYNGASSTGSTSATTYTVSGLACGSSYTLGIDAVDAAGNRSVKATVAATTAACSGSGTADFYVSPSGSDSGSCTQVAPCKTFARAFTVAPAGSVVQAADGYYGCPSISGSKSSDVTFRAAPGALPWTTCEQNISAQHIAFENMNFAGFRMGESGRYITLRNVNIACEDQAPFTLYGGLCSAGLFGAPSDFSFLGGSVGPTYDNDVYHTPGNSQLGIPYGGGPYGSTNIVLDGVRFHDNRKAAGAHTECLMVGGGTNFTIRNSKFENCNIYDIYFTWWNFVTPAYPVASNILLENNWFENPTEVAQAVRFGDYMGSFNNITVRNNSSTGDLSIGDSPKSNVQFVGNVADKASYACTSGVVYSHNVWTGAKCGATDKTAPSGFVNAATFDYHLATGSAAINAGDPANYSATDIDGQARPLGGIPDAGADESR
jgi:chitodextrinase